ncbi:MAG: LysM peptidoglycan-binding domain-containing protein [Tepidisphaeraceae bacterium]
MKSNLKLLGAALALGVMLVVVGCAKNKKDSASASSGDDINHKVTDIAPPAAPAPAYSSTPVTDVQPAYTETPVAPSGSTIAGGSSYKVKKGDTLYGIARTAYGDGKQYTRIVQANPGVTPQNLKVGQTLVIP